MKRIYVQNGIVFFYGNPAGYLGDGKAVIDCMFQKEELVSFVKELGFLEHVFREGVYDRLSEGGGVKETAEVSIGEGRRLRIYQLGQDSPIMMRFISLAERKKRGYDRPRREVVSKRQRRYFTCVEGIETPCCPSETHRGISSHNPTRFSWNYW